MNTLLVIGLVLFGILGIAEQNVEARLIDLALKRLNLTVHDNLSKLLDDKQRETLKSKVEHFHKCYDTEISRKKLNVFREKLRTVIHSYFTEFPKYKVFKKSLKDGIHRVHSFVKSIIEMAKSIIQCMEDVSNGKKPTRYGLTSLSGYSPEEFRTKILMDPKKLKVGASSDNDGKRPTLMIEAQNNKQVPNPMLDEFKQFPSYDALVPNKCFPQLSKSYNLKKPEEFTWQNKGVLGEIFHQGDCGSCWLVSTRDLMETHNRMANNITLDEHYTHPNDVRISEQDALDCSDDGCHGSLPGMALSWFYHLGAPDQFTNPYVARCSSDRQCKAHTPVLKISSFCAHLTLKEDDKLENSLKTLLLDKGPLSVAIDGRNISNLRGKYNGKMGHEINHALLLVGWTKEHWILKNSWGLDHGVNGFLYIPLKARSGIESLISFIYSN